VFFSYFNHTLSRVTIPRNKQSRKLHPCSTALASPRGWLESLLGRQTGAASQLTVPTTRFPHLARLRGRGVGSSSLGRDIALADLNQNTRFTASRGNDDSRSQFNSLIASESATRHSALSDSR
jgi:hypothetical protein